ncbi:MAG: phage tail protein [Synergistaceae bacterium]|nr:phage tail protein [Synergistaceae bacterium]MBQ3655009.1 phage tail protein [Synergistaceae bacterium]
MIGTLGSVVFEVSTEGDVRTFRDLKKSDSASYTEHKILGRKGLLEFTGTNASTCSLTIRLTRGMGFTIDPVREINALYGHMRQADALPFVVGGNVIGEGLWVIEGIDTDYKIIGAAGQVMDIEISLKLREYLDEDNYSEDYTKS